MSHKECDKKKKDVAKNAEDVSFLVDLAFKTDSGEYRRSWCLDSGATSHLTNNAKVFSKATELDGGKVILANNSNTDIITEGTAGIIADVYGESKNLILNNTLHVPDLRSNLISVAKITDRDFKVVFNKSAAEVLDDHGSVKMVADRIGDLYFTR